MNWLKSIFSGPNGDGSSKRVVAFGAFIVAIFVQFTGGGVEFVGLWLGMAGAILGVQAVTGK